MITQQTLDRRGFMLSAVAAAAIPCSLTPKLSEPTANVDPFGSRRLLVFNRDPTVCGQGGPLQFALCHACFFSVCNIIRDAFDPPFVLPFVTNSEARAAVARLEYSLSHHAVERPKTSMFEHAFEFLERIRAYDRSYGRGLCCLTKENHRYQVRLFMAFLAGGAFDIVEIGPWPYPNSQYMAAELHEHEQLLAELEEFD